MTLKPLQIAAIAIVPSVLSFSCTNIRLNVSQTKELRKQSNDSFTHGGNVAMAAIRATAVAALRQPVTTAKIGLANLWHRPRELVAGNIRFPEASSPLPRGTPPGSSAFENFLDQKRFPRAEAGTLQWLIDGPGFFPEFTRQVASAKTSIDVQVFIFDNDDVAVRCADQLKARSRDLRVRVLFDDIGSTFASSTAPEAPCPDGFTPPPDMLTYLEKDSRVNARRILDPWLSCDHTKLFVFDRKTAILGGMNLGREYHSEWHDLMVRVDGPVVDSLAREFSRAWRKAGPAGDFALIRKPSVFRKPAPIKNGIPLRVLRTDPAEGRYDILEVTLLAIRNAQTRIWIETPYFAHDDIAAACESAARRGVDVRIILPAAGDSPIMDNGNLQTAHGLTHAGAQIFQYPKMTHMKVMICDSWACVGSANLDTLSMRINRELALSFSHPTSVSSLAQKVFLPDFRNSRKLTPDETRSPAAPLAETLADQL